MSDDPTQAATPTEPTPPPPPPPPPYESPLSAARAADSDDFLDEHPEALVGAAFLGGLVLAQVIRKLGPSS